MEKLVYGRPISPERWSSGELCSWVDYPSFDRCEVRARNDSDTCDEHTGAKFLINVLRTALRDLGAVV